jgi:O-methyltransferase domain
VLESARRRVAELDVAGRCELVAGDLTRAVPGGGDVYILSRILHDWDDHRCRSILDACAAATASGGTLLVIERLIPDDDRPALATAWDIHMLCNVGGRERTAGHYQSLLNESGFDLCGQQQLPLDSSILLARHRSGRLCN